MIIWNWVFASFLGKQYQDTILILSTIMNFLMDFMVSFKIKIDKRMIVILGLY